MNDEMQYSLLDDPIIEVKYTNGEKDKINIPEIFCALRNDGVISFEALQPHQQQPWFSFLVQLAAMAVARENDGEIPTEPGRWKEMLIALADGSKAAWHLVVDDVSKPAFMQSPVPEGSLEEAKYKSDIETPDELDMLVTSKNHDVKGNRILHPQPQHWFFALLTLQTMEGIMGRGNYGIVRMNSGYGNRPFVGISPKLSWGVRFERDLEVLLNHRSNLLAMYSQNGHTLLWLPVWDGSKESTIPLAECDPFFMEICRRIRLVNREETVVCFRTNTKASRIAAPDDLNGRTEDPWTPIDKGETKSLSVGESGFTYDLLQELLLGRKYEKPIAMKFQDRENKGAFLTAKTLVRGMGKTHGLHQRIVPIPPDVNKLLINKTEKEQFSKRARNRVAIASEVQKKILYPSISSLLNNGTDQHVDFEKVAPWIDRFDGEIDRCFFESLWASVEMDPEGAKRQWETILLEEAETQFKQAERSTPIALLRRLKAVSKARSIFYGQTRKIFEFAGKQTVSTN